MKLLCSLILALFISIGSTNAQKIQIIPGKGAGKLKLGMSREAVVKVLGEEYDELSFEDHLAAFKSDEGGFAIDSILQFVLGFDYLLKYNDGAKDYPVFTVFFKNDKLSLIKFSSYIAEPSLYGRFEMEGLRFNDAKSKCAAKLGSDYLPVRYLEYDGEHVYFRKGIDVVYDEGKLTVIDIFPATPDYPKLIAQRSAQLKSQFAAVKSQD